MVFAVIVFQILMIGIFSLKENVTVSTLSIPPLFMTLIFYIFINIYWKRVSLFMELTNSLTSDDHKFADAEFLKVNWELFTSLSSHLHVKLVFYLNCGAFGTFVYFVKC